MLRYMTDRARPGLVALYNIRPGNGAGQFLQNLWGTVPTVLCSHVIINVATKKNKVSEQS